jgi:hypothetical protein
MRITITKYISIALLLTAGFFGRESYDYRVLLNSAICLGAIVVAGQAIQSKKIYWAAAFSAVALVFNPMVPAFSSNGYAFIVAISASVLIFAMSVWTLKAKTLLSIPSITDRTPGSESL